MLNKAQLIDAARCGSEPSCKDCSCYIDLRCVAHDERLAQTALAYREMLERLEWGGNMAGFELIPCCPACGCAEDEGHKPGCDLANLLRE